MPGRAYLPAGPQISWEAFDDEFVILDLETGRYFSCAGGAALLWQALLDGQDPVDTAAALGAGSPAASHLLSCFAAMQQAGLLREGETCATLAPEAALQAIRAIGEDWRFEAFEDLAALLVADPIHDSDREAGWPHQPQ